MQTSHPPGARSLAPEVAGDPIPGKRSSDARQKIDSALDSAALDVCGPLRPCSGPSGPWRSAIARSITSTSSFEFSGMNKADLSCGDLSVAQKKCERVNSQTCRAKFSKPGLRTCAGSARVGPPRDQKTARSTGSKASDYKAHHDEFLPAPCASPHLPKSLIRSGTRNILRNNGPRIGTRSRIS